jgi:hypothetical protein
MEALLGIPPLDLHAQELALNSRFRTRNLVKKTWDGLAASGMKGHIRALDDLLDLLPEVHQPDDQIEHSLIGLINKNQLTVISLPTPTAAN